MLKWSESFRIGVNEIDEQHKELFAMVNKLFDAAKSGQSKAVINEMLDFLGKYVVNHFATEEGYQKKCSYPKYDEHKQKHEDFINSFKEIRNHIDNNELNLSYIIKVNNTVADWLKNHVLKVDQEMGAFIKDKI